MPGNVLQDVGVVFDDEIQTPVFRHARLPPTPAFVILLCAEGRVPEVLEQEQRLLAKRRLDVFGRFGEGPREMRSPAELHLAWRFVFLAESLAASLCRAAINSAWSEKALDTRPALMSASALARLASMIRRCAGVYSSSVAGNLEPSITNFGVMTI